ncbi:restriction endonuclease subunit S [Pseudoalteromonas distincta]|uniref:restriction endonuclease subunit S n=1 Tax=Pseudoalteromonas distincta TaxID=77608 RepID=UPI0039E9E3BD
MSLNTNSLESMCELIVDCPHSTPEWTDSGYLVTRNQNIKNGVLNLSSPSFTNRNDYLKRVKRAEPRAGDIIFTREAPMGEVCMIPEGLQCCLGQRQVLLRPKSSVCGEYLFWALQSPFVQHQISWNEGTGSTVSNVRIPVLKALNIPRQENEAEIAKVLSDIANKIELNRQTNQTLEQIAQAMFKSWFVDFEPVRAKIAANAAGENAQRAAMAAISGKNQAELDLLDQQHPEQYQQLQAIADLFPNNLIDSELGEIPEGWKLTVLGDVLDFNPKRSLKKGVSAPYLDMKNVPTEGHLADEVILRDMASGTKFINGDTLLARITPCLENGKTAYVDFLNDGQVGWGSTEYIVMRSKGERPTSLGYFIARFDSFRTAAIQTMTGTSGRQRANAKALSEQTWLDYPIELLDIFDHIAGVYLYKAKINGAENKSLSELRNALLPHLLNDNLVASNKGEN